MYVHHTSIKLLRIFLLVHLTGIALNLQINLERTDILTLLSVPTHSHRMRLHLFT